MNDGITVRLPPEVIELAGLSPELLQAKSLLIWVLELYSEGKVTLSKAAELLDIPTDQFLDEFYKRHLKRKGGPESLKDAEEDFEIAQKLNPGS
ncbi:MAG: UPF0175 family protein [Candidatus Heimdallarchaeota archaeon]